jgi:hypothetical protein
MQARAGWLRSTDPLDVRLLKATVIVTAILLLVLPPVALLAILDVRTGWADTGVVDLAIGCLCLGGGVPLARTGRPLLVLSKRPADAGGLRVVGRLNVVLGLMSELNGLRQVGHTHSVAVVATAAALTLAGSTLIAWLAGRLAPEEST